MLLSPFSKFSKKKLKNRAILLFVLLISGIALMRYYDSFLINDVAKNGLVSFELAKDVHVSEAIMNSWGAKETIAAGFSITIDFMFLVIYSYFLALIIYMLNQKVWKNQVLYKIGTFLMYAQFIAAFFDMIENIAMLQTFKNATQFWTSVSYYFASMKFGLILLGILFIFYSLSTWLYRYLNKQGEML